MARGFAPTRLTLHKDDVAAGGHDLNVGDDDPWEVSIRSRPGDEGSWSAKLSSDECSAVAQFSVTLSNTDATSDGPGRSPARPTVVALFALLAAGLGAARSSAIGSSHGHVLIGTNDSTGRE